MFGFGNCPAELFIWFPVPCIESVITCHFEMFFRDMLDEEGDEVQNGKSFFHIGAVLVFIVVEGHAVPIVGVNARGGNDGPSKVTADVLYDSIRVAEVRLGIDIEAVFILFVDGGLGFFERRTDMGFQLIEEDGLEGPAQISVAEMFDNPPEAVIRETAFGKEAVDMGVPFEGSAEGMEDADKAGNKVSAFVEFMEEPEDDAADSLEKAVEEGAVIQEERAQVFINGKNEVPVCTADEPRGHFSRAVNAVFIAAGGAELGMAAERDEFEFAAVRTAVHGTAIGGIPAVDHFFNVFHDNRAGMKDIFNFFVVFFKNLLEDVHKTIMQEMGPESNPHPSRLRGRGVE